MTTCNTKTTHKGFFTLNLDDDLSEPAGVAPLALFFHQSVSQSRVCLLRHNVQTQQLSTSYFSWLAAYTMLSLKVTTAPVGKTRNGRHQHFVMRQRFWVVVFVLVFLRRFRRWDELPAGWGGGRQFTL